MQKRLYGVEGYPVEIHKLGVILGILMGEILALSGKLKSWEAR